VKILPRHEEEPPGEAEVALLRARAAELARGTVELAPEVEGLLAALFGVGEETYAIPLELLRAAMPLTALTPVPLAPPHVVGIVRFRGQAVTVLSFAALFGVGGWRVDPAVLVVLEGPEGRLIAIDCEHIPRAATLPAAAIAAARAAAPLGSGGKSPLLEVALPELGYVLLLEDPSPLFGDLARRPYGR
jgi:purine-binding chemotaxis protein CheW